MLNLSHIRKLNKKRKDQKLTNELLERVYWLIKLRWIASAGVLLTAFFANRVLGVALEPIPLYSVGIFLGVYNLFFLLWLDKLRDQPKDRVALISTRLANIQISMDLFNLAFLIHFSGGIENPFIFYFIFHMIIASMLLSRKASFLQATLAISLFSFMVFSEYRGILPHHCLVGFVPYTLHQNSSYIFGVSFVFMSTLYIATYMATSMAKKLRERENSLREANEELEKKDRIKSEYVMRVSHDIKEHLAAIQSCIEPVTREITGSLNEKQKDLLNRADERTGKLLTFVKALLENARLKLTSKLPMEDFNLPDLIQTIAKDIGSRAEKKNITFRVDVAPSVRKLKGVPVYIEEALLNILANAVKYTMPGGKINFNVEDWTETLLIQVKDSGVGIPEKELPHIFEEFYRAHNVRKIEKHGTGLGLSIAKEIIEMHNGDIWAESQEGKGTIFCIVLPKQG